MAVGNLKDIINGSKATSCSFNYIRELPLYENEKPYYFSGPLDEAQEGERTNLEYVRHDGVPVQDLRPHVSKLSLREHGFQLIRHPSHFAEVDPKDEDLQSYLSEMALLVKDFLQAELSVCYAYRVRKETAPEEKAQRDGPVGTLMNQDAPIFIPHTDQTLAGAPRRARRHLSEAETARYLDSSEYRLRLINCWRPLINSAEEKPLAFCDYHSIRHDSLVAADRASREYVGEIYYLQYRPDQEWYYISDQMPDEVLLFTNYDSHPEQGGPPFMPHSAFQNPRVGSDAKPRQSLETSFIVLSKLC